MSHKNNDLLYEELAMWLSEHGRSAGDIMTGSDGFSYIYIDGEEGYERVFLPDNFQSLI